MDTKSISKGLKILGGEISKNSPTLLTGAAVAGLFSTVAFAIGATPNALGLIDDEVYGRYEKSGTTKSFAEWLGVDTAGYTWKDRRNILNNRDIIKLTWKCYIPACGVGIATIFCIIGANSIHLRRNAAIASVYSITEAALKEYQSKVVETIGKNKELKIRDEISADHIQKNPSGTNEIIFTGKGDVLCYDTLSGRYFKHDIEKIRRIVNELNRDMMSDMFLSLNTFYDELGLVRTKLGDEMGWNVENGLIELTFSTQLAEDDTPCLVLNYDVIPRFMYL